MFLKRFILILFSGFGLLIQYFIDTSFYHGNNLFQVIFDTTQKFENSTTLFPTQFITIHLVNYDIHLSFGLILTFISHTYFWIRTTDGFPFEKLENCNTQHNRIIFKEYIRECILFGFPMVIYTSFGINLINSNSMDWVSTFNEGWFTISWNILLRLIINFSVIYGWLFFILYVPIEDRFKFKDN